MGTKNLIFACSGQENSSFLALYIFFDGQLPIGYFSIPLHLILKQLLNP
jgi:hypothetical protein